VVSEAVKFTVTRRTAKSAHSETQTHGFEVGLIGARGDRLVLATVKSFLGSRGVAVEHVTGQGGPPRFHRLYAMLNDSVVRDVVLDGACTRYGYEPEQVEFRLYVGKFAASTKPALHADPIKAWCAAQHVGAGPIRVVDLHEVATTARRVAASKSYRDHGALTAIKVLEAAGMLTPTPPVGDR